MSSPPASSIPASVATPMAMSSVTIASDSVPPGWTEVKDVALNKSYYWNQLTGETTWSKPVPPPPSMPPGSSFVLPPPMSIAQGTVVPVTTMGGNAIQPRISGKATAAMWCGIVGIL